MAPLTVRRFDRMLCVSDLMRQTISPIKAGKPLVVIAGVSNALIRSVTFVGLRHHLLDVPHAELSAIPSV
ncbi:hypothetical protein BN2476_1730004 [Paraburkholderia piptadeniae]|uniref:Uncharacterized protein n=1 Tax=Paraburkholderia piptadeniae TaxID=1701573 RepID=A0A1N7SXC5_9BURK|nr:hypothetical protein BN2476_1730004 [Paraburkholderia piptadeniae]